MKWRNRIAQGFSPGSGPQWKRPERASDADCASVVLVAPFIAGGWSWCPCEPSAHKSHGGDAHSVALFLLRPAFPELRRTGRADFVMHGFPGLKPWAMLCRHFMAIYPSTPPGHTSYAESETN